MKRHTGESGQVLIMALLALSTFLLAAIGLAIDGSNLFAQRQVIQAAADAAAQAGMMSIFDGTDLTGSSGLAYALKNGNASDTVTMAFNDDCPGPTIGLSDDPVNRTCVTITRSVNTTVMRLFGATASTVTTKATAAILQVEAAPPMIITHPNLASALDMNGSTSISIYGGPTKSIQVNSSDPHAVNAARIDLSEAGPTGTGGDFGVYGGSTTAPGSIDFGTTGHYIQPASPIQDPLASVDPPPLPPLAPAPLANGCGSGCKLYSPGLYDGGLDIKNATVGFKPGVYYVRGGDFSLKNTTASMCTTCGTDPDTGAGMLVYHTGAGSFVMDTGVHASFLGAGVSQAIPPAPPAAPYYGILFFQDRSAPPTTHTLGKGNGCFDLIGTVYITNTVAIMTPHGGAYQTVEYHGGPCSGTINQGEIIVSKLVLKGNSSINMELYPTKFLSLRQVALVR